MLTLRHVFLQLTVRAFGSCGNQVTWSAQWKGFFSCNSIVSFAAVIRVVTQRSSPLTAVSGEERCVTTLITAAKETSNSTHHNIIFCCVTSCKDGGVKHATCFHYPALQTNQTRLNLTRQVKINLVLSNHSQHNFFVAWQVAKTGC